MLTHFPVIVIKSCIFQWISDHRVLSMILKPSRIYLHSYSFCPVKIVIAQKHLYLYFAHPNTYSAVTPRFVGMYTRFLRLFLIIVQIGIEMKNIGFIKYEKATGREKLYFGDPEADFFVLLQGKLYSLRKQFVKSSSYFANKIDKKHKVHVIQKKLNTTAFEKVISCFYGMKCIFKRDREVDLLMEVIKYIQCQDLEQLLKNEIHQNRNEYNIFFLLEFAKKYGDSVLQQKCHNELIKNNFQHFNFNRFELLQCQVDTFANLIRLHQQLKKCGKINGLTFQNTRKIVADYNKLNSANVDLLTVLAPPASSIIIEDPEGEKDSPLLEENSRKIKKSYTSINEFDSSSQVLSLSATSSTFQDLQKATNIYESCNIEREQMSSAREHAKLKAYAKINEMRAKRQAQKNQVNHSNGSEAQKSTSMRTESSNMDFQTLNIMHGKQLLSQSQRGPFSKKQQIKLCNLTDCSSIIDFKPACQDFPIETVIESQRVKPSRLIKSQTISSTFCQ